MQNRQPAFPPLLVLAFGILAVSAASIFIRYAQEYAPSLVIAAWRLALASLILAPVALGARWTELSRLNRRQLGLAGLSGLFLALHFATWISSLEYTTVASSVVLVSTVPLWVALLSPIVLKEPITRLMLAGMFLALAGGAVVGVSDVCSWNGGLVCPSPGEFLHGQAFLGDLLALAGAIAAAGYLLIGRNLRASVSMLSYIFVVYSIAAVVLIVIMKVAGLQAFGYPSITYVWFLALALFPQLIGHSTYNWALGYLSAAYVSIALLGEPIGSTILAFILLKETPTPMKIAGAILILAGIYLASISEGPKSAQPAQES
jgi:drug/metabolite transporter (DMT)-like permease